MPDRPQSIPAPWNEGEAIRESILLYIDDPEHREILRAFGRVIFDLAIESTRLPFEESMTHVADESDLPPDEEDLAIFAGRMARQVGGLVEAIEARL